MWKIWLKKNVYIDLKLTWNFSKIGENNGNELNLLKNDDTFHEIFLKKLEDISSKLEDQEKVIEKIRNDDSDTIYNAVWQLSNNFFLYAFSSRIFFFFLELILRKMKKIELINSMKIFLLCFTFHHFLNFKKKKWQYVINDCSIKLRH